ncbi:AAA family ATPase [Microbacterium arborescens]
MRLDIPTDAIFIGGRSGVGKSSVAAAASRILARADIRHAVIEGDNLDQAYPQPWRSGLDLAEQNLAAMWANYRAAGYSRVIFTNTVSVLEIPALSAALGGNVRCAAVLLTSSDETAARRLARREIGTALDEHVRRSEAAARRLDQAGAGIRRIATDGRSVAEVALEVLTGAGWLPAEPD